MVMKYKSNLQKTKVTTFPGKKESNSNEDTRGEIKEEITKNSEVTLIFPEGSYSTWKKDITSLRKEIGCTDWDGTSWIGTNVSIGTMFYKTAVKLGIEVEGPEDMLFIQGNVTDAEVNQVLELIDICRRQCNGVVKISLHYPCTE